MPSDEESPSHFMTDPELEATGLSTHTSSEMASHPKLRLMGFVREPHVTMAPLGSKEQWDYCVPLQFHQLQPAEFRASLENWFPLSYIQPELRVQLIM